MNRMLGNVNWSWQKTIRTTKQVHLQCYQCFRYKVMKEAAVQRQNTNTESIIVIVIVIVKLKQYIISTYYLFAKQY